MNSSAFACRATSRSSSRVGGVTTTWTQGYFYPVQDAAGAVSSVVLVHVDKLRENVFVGSIHVWDGHALHRIDARTSDAVAVALGNDAPIYVAPSVLEAAGETIPSNDPL